MTSTKNTETTCERCGRTINGTIAADPDGRAYYTIVGDCVCHQCLVGDGVDMDAALAVEDVIGDNAGLTGDQEDGLVAAVTYTIDTQAADRRVDAFGKLAGWCSIRKTVDELESDLEDAIGDGYVDMTAIHTWGADAMRDGDVEDARCILRFWGVEVDTMIAHAIPLDEWTRLEELIRDDETVGLGDDVQRALDALERAADAAGVSHDPTSAWAAERLARDFELDEDGLDTSDARAVVAAVAEYM